jgi:hypothetical protein
VLQALQPTLYKEAESVKIMASRVPDAVLRLASAGWRILPCVPRRKTPLIKDWPNRSSSDGAVIRMWGQKYENCNWGVVCGKASGLWVLDVDGPAGEASLLSLIRQHGDLPNTLTAITARGRHLYFKYPKSGTVRTSNGILGARLDVRSDRAYVIIPPSIHPTGVPYCWPDSRQQIAIAPHWLVQAVMTTGQRKPAPPKSEIGILYDGLRNDGLTRLAGALRRKGATRDEIEAELLLANDRRCRPPLPDHDVRKIAGSVARYAPGGPDPLEVAWQSRLVADEASNYERFLQLCRKLQVARPNLPIVLPVVRIATLFHVHYTLVCRYRKRAVACGLLIPADSYIPHRLAGTYYVSLVSLTSGLVRHQNMDTPSETPHIETPSETFRRASSETPSPHSLGAEDVSASIPFRSEISDSGIMSESNGPSYCRTLPCCPRCKSYALYRKNNTGFFQCPTCGLNNIDEIAARKSSESDLRVRRPGTNA